MPLHIVLGAQWGDEGKGRITHLLAGQASVTARYSGGDNAGHTVTVGERIFKLHLLPSGLVDPRGVGVLGNGMVVNPARLLAEMEGLAQAGLEVSPARLKLSHAAHLITPAHLALDQADEAARAQAAGTGHQIGTTGRGIGPAYIDKSARRGLRAALLLDPQRCAEAVAAHTRQANHQLQAVYGQPPLEPERLAAEFAGHAQRLGAYVTDTSLYLHQRLRLGESVLAEGAQGTLLDLDHGTYPFVTSSSSSAGGALTGLGLGAQFVGRVIGVAKTFQTRVGAGPFPTEIFGPEAERLRGTGENPWDEFGTTTGRPRRCGWLDLVLLRYAARVNGLTELVLTKLDILSGLPRLRLCTAYRAQGREHAELPLGPADLSPFEPVYEELPGWQADVSGARAWDDLPAEARAYVGRIEALTGVPVSLISVGPERDQVIPIRSMAESPSR